MKITHVIPELTTGGAQRLLADLLPVMASDPEMELTLVVYRSVKDSDVERALREDSRIRFVNLDLKQMRSLSPAFRLVSEVRRADVVHAHLFPALYHVALAAAIAGTPAVFTEHSSHNRRRDRKLLRPLERMVYAGYSEVCAISGSAAESLAAWLGRESVEVVANGVDMARFSVERPHASQLPMIFGRGGRAVLMVSRFAPSKDQATLIRAMGEIEDPDVFAAFAGSGETLEECRRIAEAEGVAGRVVFLGDRDDVPRLVAAAEVGVQSSRWEGFGLSAAEMMAGGLPLIASDVAGLRDLVEGAGELFAKGDHKDLAQKISRILALGRDSAEIAAMGRREAERAAMHDIGATARRYKEIYLRSLRNP